MSSTGRHKRLQARARRKRWRYAEMARITREIADLVRRFDDAGMVPRLYESDSDGIMEPKR